MCSLLCSIRYAQRHRLNSLRERPPVFNRFFLPVDFKANRLPLSIVGQPLFYRGVVFALSFRFVVFFRSFLRYTPPTQSRRRYLLLPNSIRIQPVPSSCLLSGRTARLPAEHTHTHRQTTTATEHCCICSAFACLPAAVVLCGHLFFPHLNLRLLPPSHCSVAPSSKQPSNPAAGQPSTINANRTAEQLSCAASSHDEVPSLPSS